MINVTGVNEMSCESRLTERQREVLQLVADGLSNRDIGERLNVSERTVGHHVRAILERLDVANRTSAATWYERHHATEPPSVERRSTSNPDDASRFVRDVEFFDGTTVSPGQQFRKTWEIQNIGKVVWHRRYLQRIGANRGPGLVESPKRVPIKTTRPGEMVQISVILRAPSTEGTPTAKFKMADKDGNLYFPDRYPAGLFLTVNVVEEH